MGPEDWIGGIGAVLVWAARWVLRGLLCLWWWGPHPDTAYEPGSYGDRTVGRTYRRAWRSGQVIGWGVITVITVIAATMLTIGVVAVMT